MSYRADFARRPAGSEPDRSQPVRREGFALPLSIMVLALLTMGLVAGFAVSTTEQSTLGAQRGQARAYGYAQMGLEQFLTRRKEVINTAGQQDTFCKHCWLMNRSLPNGGGVLAKLDTLPTKKETTYVSLTGGAAIVRAYPVWVNVAAGQGTYYITSTGTDLQSGAGVGFGKTSEASRTVGAFVTWNKQTINVLGALVSFGGVVKNGTGAVSGTDACGGAAAVPGITVPADVGVVLNGAAKTFVPTGNPPYDSLKTFSEDSAAAQLDWKGIKYGDAMPADIVIGSGTFPSVAKFTGDTNYWPTIHITNGKVNGVPGPDFVLPNKGRGMLIVDGDLTINGSNQWDGVVLVGGRLTSNGTNVTSGTIMTGLNRLIGEAVATTDTKDDDALNGTKSFQYNSCSVAKATSSMARYTLLPNTWMDNVTGY